MHEKVEKEQASGPKLEAMMKRYRFRDKTLRRIHIPERFNEKEELEKYDRATEKGQRYCIVTIELLPESNLTPRKPQ